MREGRVHSLLLSGFWRGGGPMMAPSMKVIGMGSGAGSLGGEEEKRLRREDCRRIGLGSGGSAGLVLRMLEISVTVLGEIAFKSMNVRVRGADVVPRRVFRAVMPADERQASAMRRAVAMASRGGTILSMMSACETRSESFSKRLIFADLILEIVDELYIYQNGRSS